MTIVVVHKSACGPDAGGVSATSAGGDTPFTSTAGNLLVALGAAFDTSGADVGFSDGGISTWVPGFSGNNGGQYANIGYAKNIPGKSNQTVTYTLGSTDSPSVCLLEVSGCDTTAPLSVSPSWTSNGAASSLTKTITPVAGTYLLVVNAADDVAGVTQSITDAGTGAVSWTTIKNDSAANTEPQLIAYAVVTATGTNTYGVTYNGTGGHKIILGMAAFQAQTSSNPVYPGLPAFQLTNSFIMNMAKR